MLVTCLRIQGLKVIEPRIFCDERGFFLESYRQPLYATFGIEAKFVQDNLSFSHCNTLRGLHYQPGQDKLISVMSGTIWDVAVDLRPGSSTFGQYEGVELDGELRRQLFVPDGFAHGFCVLSKTALVQYKVSAIYDPAKESSLRWNDRDLNIPWPCKEPIVSSRDQMCPFFKQVFKGVE
jgi:dTDP-4-dehydrorhamnose 3,5-epimerase